VTAVPGVAQFLDVPDQRIPDDRDEQPEGEPTAGPGEDAAFHVGTEHQ
jgi:hypothetical protein